MNYIQYYFRDSNFWVYVLFMIFIIVIGINNLVQFNKIIMLSWIVVVVLSFFIMYCNNKLNSKFIINTVYVINYFLLILFASEYSNNEVPIISILFIFIFNIFLLGYMAIKRYLILVVLQLIIILFVLVLMYHVL